MALSGVRLCVGDGATVTRSMVRKPGDVIVGHVSIRTQLTGCKKLGVPRASFTHLGSEIGDGDERAIGAKIRHLASQLPQEAKGFLYEHVDSQATQREAGCFTLEEFYNRVGARTDVTYTHAVERARAVVTLLEAVLPEGEIDRDLLTC